MVCYSPLHGYRSQEKTVNGKRKVVFSSRTGYIDMPVTIPCGQCIGCRLERSRQWAVRCVHEAQMHKENCFVTLTYNDYHLPYKGTLVKSDFQKFMKRLRKKYKDKKIRFFHCGEYGSNMKRPHYHACLFNHDFKDKKIWNIKKGNTLYVSNELNEIWGKGYCIIGNVTFESAAYIARYIIKKITGDKKEEHYKGKQEEYITMSRRPGIARAWYDMFGKEVYPADNVVLRGRKLKPPKYYDRIFDLTNHEEFDKIRYKRVMNAKKHKEDNTEDRLRVREKCLNSRLSILKRSYENDVW